MATDGLAAAIQIAGMGRTSKVNYVIDLEMYGMESSLNRRTLKDSTEYLIRSMLLRGEMKVGEIYSANALAKELNISNSPVREAMMSLVDRGLLKNVRNRGFRVVELSDADSQEIYDLRLLIEVEAVRRVAAMELDEAQSERLRSLAKKTDELHGAVTGEDMFRYLEADQQFHLYLVSLTGNGRWVQIVERLRDQSRANGYYLDLMTSGKVRQTATEHLEIVEAVLAQDDDVAEGLMVRHLDYACPKGKK